jgi:hypothetical protein
LIQQSAKAKKYLQLIMWQIWPLPGIIVKWQGYVHPRPYLMNASLKSAVIRLWLVVWRCQAYNEWVLLLRVWFDVTMTTTPIKARRVQAPAVFSKRCSVAVARPDRPPEVGVAAPWNFVGRSVCHIVVTTEKYRREMCNVNCLVSYDTDQKVTTRTLISEFL